MKTHEDIKNDIEALLEKNAGSDAFATYLRENMADFPEEMQEELFPILFEYDLDKEVNMLEKIESILKEKFPELLKED